MEILLVILIWPLMVWVIDRLVYSESEYPEDRCR